jgi:hypothetical protein
VGAAAGVAAAAAAEGEQVAGGEVSAPSHCARARASPAQPISSSAPETPGGDNLKAGLLGVTTQDEWELGALW